MFRKIFLSLSLFGSLHHTQAQDNAWQNLKTACVVVGIIGTVTLSYKAYAQWLVKRAQAHFAHERNLLHHYANYSAQTQSWTTHDAAVLLRDLKSAIVHLHNTNRDRWDISIMYDIYYGQPAMYVSTNYHHYPLLQHVNDISWYVSHLKTIRFLHAYSNELELTSLIEQLEYIRQMLLSDHSYSLEEAQYQATRNRQ